MNIRFRQNSCAGLFKSKVDDYADQPKRKVKAHPKKTIYDAFEPDELIEKYYTDYDKFLRDEDEPERFLTRGTL